MSGDPPREGGVLQECPILGPAPNALNECRGAVTAPMSGRGISARAFGLFYTVVPPARLPSQVMLAPVTSADGFAMKAMTGSLIDGRLFLKSTGMKDVPLT